MAPSNIEPNVWCSAVLIICVITVLTEILLIIYDELFLIQLVKKSETRMTASVPKQDPNTRKGYKKIIFFKRDLLPQNSSSTSLTYICPSLIIYLFSLLSWHPSVTLLSSLSVP